MNKKDIAITLDTDWAPDFIIDQVISTLIENSVKATWFITHESPAIKRLADYPELFELGIHPNFATGSTHGQNPSIIMDHCLDIVPDAISMRTHNLVQSTALLKLIMTKYPIKVDVSIFMPYQFDAFPFVYNSSGRSLLRIPYIWEDDHEFEQMDPNWSVEQLLQGTKKLSVINFHPVHIYLNSRDMHPYLMVKELQIPLYECLPHHFSPHISDLTAGTGHLFERLLTSVNNGIFRSVKISDIYEEWQQPLASCGEQ